jgi:UDP-glucose 4-epimerase
MGVLVTGGAGYIGSVVTESLLKSNEKVVSLDDLSTGHRAAVPDGAEFIEGRVGDAGLIESILARHEIDTVMHFAASCLVTESCKNPMKYFRNNVTSSQILLETLMNAGVRQFVLSSTCSIYGNPDTLPITEDMPARPLNPYGLSKRMTEQMLEWCDAAYDLRYVSLRYFNACGASPTRGEDHDPETHLIPSVLLAAAGRRKNVQVFGDDYPTPDGTCVRDYIHVEDLADAHLKAMGYLRDGHASEIINLGNSVGISVLDVIAAVERVTGRKVRTVQSRRRPGDAAILVASFEKARTLLGWVPRKSDIDTIVTDAWSWMKTHPQGYLERGN